MTDKAQKQRENIIHNAREVISDIGVHNTTLKIIAEKSGISKGALYHYYKSKDDIIYDIMEQDNSESGKMVELIIREKLEKETLIDDIASGIIQRIVNDDKNRLNLYLQGEALQGNKELIKRYKKKYNEWLDNIDSVILAIFNVEKSSYVRTFSSIALAAIEGMCIQKMITGELPCDREDLKKMILNILADSFTGIKELLNNWG